MYGAHRAHLHGAKRYSYSKKSKRLFLLTIFSHVDVDSEDANDYDYYLYFLFSKEFNEVKKKWKSEIQYGGRRQLQRVHEMKNILIFRKHFLLIFYEMVTPNFVVAIFGLKITSQTFILSQTDALYRSARSRRAVAVVTSMILFICV